MEELQGLLHGFRKDIDAVTQNVKTLKDNPTALVCGREIALTITKLEEAKMWLGKALGETGSEMPAHLADNAGPVTPDTTPSVQVETAPQAPVVPTIQEPVQPTAPEQPAAAVAQDQAQVAPSSDGQPQQ